MEKDEAQGCSEAAALLAVAGGGAAIAATLSRSRRARPS